MAKDLISCIGQIQSVATGLSGVSDPGHAALDSISNSIFALTEPAGGTLQPTANFAKGLHDIRILIACKIDDYARYRATLIPLIESFYTALRADVTLAATCDTITGISYTFGQTQHGTYPVYGAVFTIGVKIQ